MSEKIPISRRTALTSGAALSALGATGLGAVGMLAGSPSLASDNEPVTKPYGLPISAEFPFRKKFVAVDGARIAYVDEGEGQPVLFLHGNPTSSYLWRNIIPHVAGPHVAGTHVAGPNARTGYRAIAPDMIGMGDSDKPDIAYTFQDHIKYIEGFITALGLKNLILVVHDWGSAIGMRYARLNPNNVAAMAYMEAIVPPSMPAPDYDAMGPQIGELFRKLRTDGVGEKMVLEGNFFVEEILQKMGVMRRMAEAEMKVYRAPYPTPESRLPTLQWPRELPIGGNPAFANGEVLKNGEWLLASEIPKLLFHAEPGALTPKPVVEYMAANVPNLEIRFLGAGTHFLQEDHPHLIGQGLADWLRRI